jgi:hypothetical protein
VPPNVNKAQMRPNSKLLIPSLRAPTTVGLNPAQEEARARIEMVQ